jgi:predicted AAA+ superfamily ATPase
MFIMKEYHRTIEQSIKKRLFESGKIIVLYGPRQVGKTTLAKKILKDYKSENGYFNCEILTNREALTSGIAETMRDRFGGHKVIVLDEAQTVENIGRALKIFIDAYPETNIIATGSSSFDLANKINEPLTGRHYEFFLSPLSTEELIKASSKAVATDDLNTRLIYGNYPEVVNAENDDRAQEKLELIATSYLYRDVLQFNAVKNSEVLNNILKALAHQVGSEVSYNEIANLVGIDRKTVMSYVSLLEQAFIIFRLLPLTNNKRDEIKKLRKVYFYDNGIVNALTRNFAGVETGRDMGGLWENYMVSERLKWLKNHNLRRYMYYWRRNRGGEVDYIEEYNGEYYPYEFKFDKNEVSAGAREFSELYKTKNEIKVINRSDFLGFVS